ncbi:hypothetical protein [Halovivax cerinus]|uniref:Transcription factor zinc-finger domain-containing protein n=1 Tax=Halovivax cerinus TaxID=1487865 RepID=A0ABD5NTH6_9EURY|nr:hypothetical protein [Halovivax cerinus]
MDTCPRCQSPLERLSLAETTTVACSRCGFADVPVEHEAEWQERETWHEAMERFYER